MLCSCKLLNIKIYAWLIDPVYGISREDTKENSVLFDRKCVCWQVNKSHCLVGKLNICLLEKKNKFLTAKELLIFPLNTQDKEITILRGLPNDAVTVTMLFGPCSVVI